MTGLPRIALNGGLVLAALAVAGLRASLKAYWGPEGPVGAGLLFIPPLLLVGIVLTVVVTSGQFDWLPGGRFLGSILVVGYLIGFGAALAIESDAGWVLGLAMVAAVAVVVNAGGSRAVAGVLIAAGAVAGWVVVGRAMSGYLQQQERVEQSKVEQIVRYENEQSDEFRALGKDAPLWNYFSYMYMPNEALRRECREIIASRPDLNERLVEFLRDPVMAHPAINYIGDVAEHPAAELAPAVAAYSDGVLGEYRELLRGKTEITDRTRETVTGIFAAAERLKRGGGDMRAAVREWRDFLRGFKNAGDLVKRAEALL
jgi:hypothetical protein